MPREMIQRMFLFNNSFIKVNENILIRRPFFFYKIAVMVNGLWLENSVQIFIFFSTLFDKPVFYTEASGGRWVSIEDAVIFDPENSEFPVSLMCVFCDKSVNGFRLDKG